MSKHKLIKVAEAAIAWVDACTRYEKEPTEGHWFEKFTAHVELLNAVKELKRAEIHP